MVRIVVVLYVLGVIARHRISLELLGVISNFYDYFLAKRELACAMHDVGVA